MPASAHASSLSETSPEMPTAPSTAPARVADEHAAGGGHDAAVGHGVERGEERLLLRLLGHPAGQRAGAEAHAERAPRLADRDLRPHDPRTVLARERLEMTAGVQHGHGQRRAVGLAARP